MNSKTFAERLESVKHHPFGSFCLRLYKRYDDSNLVILAAALAYYAAFSLGPLLVLLAGWLSVFLRSRSTLRREYQDVLVRLVEQVLPLQQDSGQLVTQSFDLVLDELGRGALLRSLISVAVLLWASSNFFTVLQRALELTFGVPKIRGYWRKRVVALFLVASVALIIFTEIIVGLLASSLGQIAAAIVLAVNETVGVSLSVPIVVGAGGLWAEILRTVLATLTFTLCFRFLPKNSSTWWGAFAGATFSTGSILVMRWIFEQGFDLARFNLIYGVITGLLIILLWLYFAMLMFLVGALLAAEISAMLRPQLRELPEAIPERI